MLYNKKPPFLDKAEKILALEKNLSVGIKTQDTDNSLLNCPFCGSDWIEVVKVLNTKNKNKFYIRCLNCGARTRSKNLEQDAINLWNRRSNNV